MLRTMLLWHSHIDVTLEQATILCPVFLYLLFIINIYIYTYIIKIILSLQ